MILSKIQKKYVLNKFNVYDEVIMDCFNAIRKKEFRINFIMNEPSAFLIEANKIRDS